MTILRRLLVLTAAVLLLVAVWMWWTRPVPVSMAEYVPADALVYFEVNDLSAAAHALASTEPLRSVPAEQRRGLDWAATPWLQRLVSFTGMAPHRAVVLSRAQVAVAVLGFEAREEAETSSLNFTPRVVVVAETHTPEWRTRVAVEHLVGDLARAVYGNSTIERREIGGVPFVTWVSAADARRRIVAAIADSTVIIGNDEAAVRTCLEVRDGARQSLASDERLGEMRERVGGDAGAFAFGYAPPGSAAKVVDNLAPAFVGGVTDDPQVQGLFATLLPRMAGKIVGAAGWSARLADGLIEERYLVRLPGDIAERLRAPFAPYPEWSAGAADVLPPETSLFTQYSFRSPELAWRGLNAAITTQFDVTGGPLVTRGLEALAEPYGVERPREFLRAVGPEIVTAQIAPESERKVLVVEAFDRDALRAEARRFLGPRTKLERIEGAELYISADEGRGAAALLSGRMLMGDENDLRRCIEASHSKQTLRTTEAFKLLSRPLSDEPAFARTLSDDGATIISVLSMLTNGRALTREEMTTGTRYSVSETRLTGEGFEKRTRSAFGLLGELLSRAAPGR